MPHRAPQQKALEVAIAIAILVVFAVDVRTPLGVVVWVFYVLPSLGCLLLWRPRAPLVVAAVESLLIVVGFYLSPEGGSPSRAMMNRSFGVLVVGALGVAGNLFIRNRLMARREDWVRSGKARLMTRMQGDPTMEQLADAIVSTLVPYVGAAAGVVYVGNADRVRPLAAWGVRKSELSEAAAGEGLVGRVLVDRKELLVDDLPTAGLALDSGIGAARTTSMLLVPAIESGVLHGVVQVAAFHGLSEEGRTLLTRAAEPIAIAIRSAEYRERLKELLDETQRQAEALQTQQEELRVANEELQEQTNALRAAQAQLESQQDELETANATLEEQTNALEQAQQGLLEKASALERASRYKSEFLANMSHELRTPLNSSLILAKLLVENPRGNLDAEQVRFAETIYNAGNDLLGLINDILDLSKIEAGRMDVSVAATDPRRVVADLARIFEPIASQKKLPLRTSVAPDVPEVLHTDVQRLEQVLKNLLANALKFTTKGSVSLSVTHEGDNVVFRVTDTGIGIAEEHHDAIFEAFRQADGTTNRRFGGTGLGLSISRQLAQLLGGEVSVESSVPGQGSTFRLVLPLERSASRVPSKPEARARRLTPPRPSPAPALPPPNARSLLVVEDDPTFASVLETLGRELDFVPILATTASDALSIAKRQPPTAIILDVGLPDGSGLSVLDRLKRDPATRHVPVHVVSAGDYTEQALALGAAGYLLKPVSREELSLALATIREQVHAVRKLLIVEDDPATQESIRALLGGNDIEIRAVSKVEDALAALRATTFDCVVTDLALEDGTGFDLLEKMAGDDAFAFPPVIVYTGRELSAEEEQRLRRYSRSVIVKGARSPERLLDEATLFLHRVEAQLPPERRRQLEQARDRDKPFEGRTVLVVEDDVRNVFALTSILEHRGARVVIARNGREALDKLAAEPAVDIVLMDLMMPEMDGLSATREIRKQPRFAKLPIIALTAKAMPDDRAESLRAGANDYIAKPLDLETLVSLLRVWMPR